MLRTIIVRNEVVKSGLKKAVRSNIARCLSTEAVRRKHHHKLLNPTNNKIISSPQWTIQFRLYSDLPEHIKVNLPALSPTMETGTIVSWDKKEGDQLNEGDLLCEIETDKATMGFETPEEGYLAKIIIPTGTKGVPVGKLLCIICDNKDDVAAFKDFKDDSPPPSPPKSDKDEEKESAPEEPAEKPAEKEEKASSQPAESSKKPAEKKPASPPPESAAPKESSSGSSRVYASPMAKRLAEIKKLRLEGSGSGLYGSLKSGDLSGKSAAEEETKDAPADAPASPKPGQAYVDIPLSGMRTTIAKRLTQSKQSVPHYQLTMNVNIDKMLEMRKSVNELLEKEKAGVKVSVNDFIIKAVAASCKRVPSVNAQWMDSFIRQFSNVDVSVAVATPAGLITPIIANAESRGIIDISKNMKELAAKAKDGKLKPEEYQGGTVTVSNLGMFGITMFNAIINPPQSLILACGGMQELVIPDSSKPEGWRVGKFINVTASADHRVIDGAVGAEWMKVLKTNLEDPANCVL